MASELVPFANPVKFGDDLELDPGAYELRRAGRPPKLERIPMELLLLLVEQRGQLVTREHIIERIWGKDVFLDADSSINSAIRKIRLVLKDDPEQPRFLQTVTGRGYRFIATVLEDRGPAAIEVAAPPQAAAGEKLIGKEISHYRILSKLGSGGMGVVYEAEDVRLGRRVALKLLPESLARDQIALQRFEREARAASSLNHPNICTIYEVEEHDHQQVIVMELLEGKSLKDRIREGPISTDELLDFGIQTSDALEAAHAKGIIHRDMKPGNIFVVVDGRVKIWISDWPRCALLLLWKNNPKRNRSRWKALFQAQQPTCLRSRSEERRLTRAATCFLWVWCFTKWRPASGLSLARIA
jgi:DNA-binding winged helix-turn-helix (wHTH) protein/predicted Ser/Thr protein kinase